MKKKVVQMNETLLFIVNIFIALNSNNLTCSRHVSKTVMLPSAELPFLKTNLYYTVSSYCQVFHIC
jgi:hypothetical protein